MNLKSIFPYGSNAFYDKNSQVGRELPATVPQPTSQDALVKTSPGKTKSYERVTLRYRIFRVRLQDTDNSFGSTKALTDALGLCKLIPGDDPQRLRLIVKQEKVSRRDEEKVEIEIKYP